MTDDLPRSASGSRKTSDRSVTGELCRSATAPAVGESFDEVVLPHLRAGHRLARWLIRNEHDAQDVVQEASMRAFRYFRTFAGGNGRAWFLRIVRNTCRSWRGQSGQAPTECFDEERHSSSRPAFDPETLALQAEDVILIERAMRNLPGRSRELLVLRELEGLSYRELAAVMGIPMGTVMSSLSRARQAFRRALDDEMKRPDIAKRTYPLECLPPTDDEISHSSLSPVGGAPTPGADKLWPEGRCGLELPDGQIAG